MSNLAPMVQLANQTWVGTLIGVVGLVAGLVFFVLSRRRARLAYCWDRVTLIDKERSVFPSSVEVRVCGTDVSCLSLLTVAIWNEGERTIRKSDVVELDPLRLELVTEGAIIDARVVAVTRDVNQFVVRREGGRVGIGFEFLDSQDGALVDLLVDGGRPRAKLAGTIQGIPAGPKNLGRSPKDLRRDSQADYSAKAVLRGLQAVVREGSVLELFRSLFVALYGLLFGYSALLLLMVPFAPPVQRAAAAWGSVVCLVLGTVGYVLRLRIPSGLLEPKQDTGSEPERKQAG